MNELYTFTAETEKYTQSFTSKLGFTTQDDAISYINMFKKYSIKQNDNVMIKYAARWFEVKLYLASTDKSEFHCESLQDSLVHLPEDFKGFKDYIEDLATCFFDTQFENNIKSPDMSDDGIEDDFSNDPFRGFTKQKSRTDKGLDFSSNQEPLLTGG